mmetsp:Transcript_57563/g.134870  ORF Transcript_57563/g.134870 Transcript_57563/m.134870 type:complete len:841 (-) Transcript_57563:44-2566(-)
MLERWLLLIGVACSYAYRIRAPNEQRGDWQESELLNVRLWTWNSGKANLSQEAARLANTTADFIVTCQTEATVPIDQWMPPEWKLVARGTHWGAAGGTVNAQMAAVFARRPLVGELLGDVSDVVGRIPWRSDVAAETTIRHETSGDTKVAFIARAQVIATDYKGKGGVSIALNFPQSPARKPTRVDFVCAHLDSESSKVRADGIATMLGKVRTYNDTLANMLRTDSGLNSAAGELDRACSFFDRGSAACDLPEEESLGILEPPPDAVLILGDLNYRLAKAAVEESGSKIQAMLWSPSGRRKLAESDPLLPRSNWSDKFVKPVEENGLGFECNRPYGAYLPTYKRNAGEDCKLLGQKLAACKKATDYCTWDNLETWTRSCYQKQDKKTGEWSWPTKKEFMQLGWLDRFCFRTTSGKEDLQLSLKDNAGWTDYPGKQDKKDGSDHMPVAATLQLGYTACHCSATSDVIVDACRCADGVCVHGLRGGEVTSVHCEDGKVLVDEHGQAYTSLEVQCKSKEGSLTSLASALNVSKLTCRKACWSYNPAEPGEHWELLQLGKLPVAEGTVIHPHCPKDMVYLGATAMKCEASGLVPLGLPPICVPQCHVRDLPSKLWLQGQWPASLQMLNGAYHDQIIARFGSSKFAQFAILEGGSQMYACQNRCTTLGLATSHCNASGLLSPPAADVKCACSVDLVVQAVRFADPALESQVDYLKLQFYGGPTEKKELEKMREQSSYVAALKFKPKDSMTLTKKPLRVDGLGLLDGLEAHITLCSKKRGSTFHRWFSSCGILAETSPEQASRLKQLLSQVTEPEGTVDMDFSMAWKQQFANVTITVKYTTDLAGR